MNEIKINYDERLEKIYGIYYLTVDEKMIGKLGVNSHYHLTGWKISFPEKRKMVENVEESFQDLAKILFGHRIDLMDRAVRHGLRIRTRHTTPDGYHFKSVHFPLQWDGSWEGPPEGAERILENGATLFDNYKEVFTQPSPGSIEEFDYNIQGWNVHRAAGYDHYYKNLGFNGVYTKQGGGKPPRDWWVGVESSFEYLPNAKLLEWMARHHRDGELFAEINYEKTAKSIQDWIRGRERLQPNSLELLR